MKPVRLFSLNTFLIPKLFAKKSSDGLICHSQNERANRIVQEVGKSGSQIVALQEVWGTEVAVLDRSLQKTHSVIPGYESVSLFGFFSNAIDSLRFYIAKTGGLWLAHSKEMPLLHNQRRTYSISSTASKKGVQASKIRMDLLWRKDSTLLLFNTHLDAVEKDGSRKQQIKELYSFVLDTCKRLGDKNDAGKMGVILLGDFNIDSKSTSYKELMEGHDWKMRDLFDDVKKGVEEVQFTHEPTNSFAPGSTPSRIDFVFTLDSIGEGKGEETLRFLKLRSSSFNILRYPHGQELSDHNPQIVDVIPKEDESR